MPKVVNVVQRRVELEQQFHPSLNLVPNLAAATNKDKLWWLGECGHEWDSSLASRLAMGSNCPYCSNQRVLPGYNDLAFLHPEVAAEWHPTLNYPLLPSEVTPGTARRVFWKGARCGHEWDAKIALRAKGEGCHVCSGKKVVPGVNDFASLHPDLLSQWHPHLNGSLDPTAITDQANRDIWWLGVCGHEWKTSLAHRTRKGAGCPYCTNRLVLAGFNDLATVAPELAAEWHPTKNTVPLSSVISGSNLIRWWQCSKGHGWETSVANRQRLGHGCPSCSGHRAIPGETDLETLYPDIAAEWHPTKNDKKPSEVMPGSSTGAWWLCNKGHDWKASPSGRTGSQKTGCPYCKNKKVLLGFNDLATTHPAIAAEWDVDNTVSPEECTAGTDYYARWCCAQGHVWSTYVYNRTSKGKPTSCPECSATNRSSKGETEIASWCEDWGFVVERNTRKPLRGKELDIYIPSEQVAIEFNGVYWHSDAMMKDAQTNHYKKWQAAQAAGIQLIQIWEDEWNHNPEQVKRMLAHKLGVRLPGEKKVMARKTRVVEVTKERVEAFLDEHHIQGFASGSHYLGLVEAGDIDSLVAVLVLKKEAGTAGKVLNIIRYATSAIVSGGFTKLLKHAEREYEPDSFITFSDHCVSDGGLYRNNGFVADKELRPDYMYVVRAERKHKFGYRLKRFRDDPALQYQEGLTEKELAQLNGLTRIWDAGKTRWVRTVRSSQ